jgi:hypothetical protein
MDVLAVSEGVIHVSDNPAEVPGEGNGNSEEQVQQENKFQRAISVWRGMVIFGLHSVQVARLVLIILSP